MRQPGEGQEDTLQENILRPLHAFLFGDSDFGGIVFPGTQYFDLLLQAEAGMLDNRFRALKYRFRITQGLIQPGWGGSFFMGHVALHFRLKNYRQRSMSVVADGLAGLPAERTFLLLSSSLTQRVHNHVEAPF
jgi:hypothetical protein